MLPVPLSGKELDRVFKQPIPKYFTQAEVVRILSANAHDLRAYLVVNTLWKTGLRCSEMLSLKKEALDPYGKLLRVKTLKQGEKKKPYAGVGRRPKAEKSAKEVERILPIPDDLVTGLLAWIHSSENGAETLFHFSRPTAFRIVRKACERAGLDDSRAHPHSFRHAYAVHLLREGVPITILKELLGHSNIASTLVYLRITQPDKRAIFDQVQW